MVGDQIKYESGFAKNYIEKGRNVSSKTVTYQLEGTGARKSSTAALNLTGDDAAIRQLKLVSKARKTHQRAMKDYVSNGTPMLSRWAKPSDPPKPNLARKERAQTATAKSRARTAQADTAASAEKPEQSEAAGETSIDVGKGRQSPTGLSSPGKVAAPQALAKISEKRARRRGLQSASVQNGRFKRGTMSANMGSAMHLYGMKSNLFLSELTTEADRQAMSTKSQTTNIRIH